MSNRFKIIASPKNVLQIIFLVIVTAFAILYLIDQWDQLQAYAVNVNWALVLVAQVGLIAGMMLLAVNAWLLFHRMTALHISYRQIYKLFFLSTIAKYLPGGIWMFPGRLLLYQNAGLPVRQGIPIIAWEILMLMLGALLVTLLGVPILATVIPLVVIIPLAVVGLILCGWAFASGQVPGASWLLHRVKIPLLIDVLGQDLRPIRVNVYVMVTCWLILGASFAVIVYAVAPDLPLYRAPQLIGVFTGAWLVGFVIVIAPGGIGVRDGVLILLLTPILPAGAPVLVTLLSRILWTIAELANLSISYVVARRKHEPTTA
jgi:glycosyltransferase 2 family protein